LSYVPLGFLRFSGMPKRNRPPGNSPGGGACCCGLIRLHSGHRSPGRAQRRLARICVLHPALTDWRPGFHRRLSLTATAAPFTINGTHNMGDLQIYFRRSQMITCRSLRRSGSARPASNAVGTGLRARMACRIATGTQPLGTDSVR